MDNLEQKILNNLRNDKDVFLVGLSDSGKTFFILNTFIPFLKKMGLKSQYFSNCEEISSMQKVDIVIIDENETLLDKEYLEIHYPKKTAYYSAGYLSKIKEWHKSLKKIQQPCLYVITRKNQKDIDNFLKIGTKTDWNNKKVISIEFSRGSLGI